MTIPTQSDTNLRNGHTTVQELLKEGRFEDAKCLLEIEKLQSEVVETGRFSRISLPIIQAVATSVVAIGVAWLTYTIQSAEAGLKSREVFLTALGNATDAKSADTRIGGMWVLNKYWDTEDADVIASVLAASLTTGSDKVNEESDEKIRLTAAEVIGGAIGERRHYSSFWLPWESRARSLKRILYGVGSTGEVGKITRLHWNLIAKRKELQDKGEDTTVIEQKLYATRQAIRKNWEFLEDAHFGQHDLTKIELYASDLREAYLGEATLVAANLSGADLYGANLTGANLAQVKGWRTTTIHYANIQDVKSLGDAEQNWALDHHAVQMDAQDWEKWNAKERPQPHDWATWRNAHFRLMADGSPAN